MTDETNHHDELQPLGETLHSSDSPRPSYRPPGNTFAAGDVAAGRYRITRFIGKGGMGEVYEAEDLELNERIALKTIRPDVASDKVMVSRFKRETHLARKVTHPNVCRIFDLGYHIWPAPEGVQSITTMFLTMELLDGETLAERLRRQQRLSTEEALPVIRQIAEALNAAHSAGIVHRDFKCENVILTPAGVDWTSARAVVTDFGMARDTATGQGPEATLTATGGVVGTPAYMAPEQVEGGHVTRAADIYAFGVVIYKMLTGAWPFEAETPVMSLIKRLREAPTPPHQRMPGIDPRWESVILHCLERDPTKRFATAREVLAALAGEETATVHLPGGLIKRSPGWIFHRKWPRVIAGALLLAVLAIAGVIVLRRSPPPKKQTGTQIPPSPRRSVAVLGFKNLSGHKEIEWLATALGEMLGTEMAADGKLRTIPGENISRLKIDLALGEADSLGQATLAKVRQILGVDFIVSGAYLAIGEGPGTKIRLDIHLQETLHGETVKSWTESGGEGDLFSLVSRAGAQLRASLGVGELSATDARGVRAALPADPESTRLYAEGLARLRQFDALAARELLTKAIEADPSHALAHAALADAWSALGYDQRAKDEAQHALRAAGNLTREDRLNLEGRFNEITQQWDKAVNLYRSLWTFYPDNLEYGLRLTHAMLAADAAAEARAMIPTLHRLPPPVGDDPRIDLAEAAVAEAMSEFQLQQTAAAKAAGKCEASGARLMLARARLMEGTAYRELGKQKEALAMMAQSREIYAAAGDQGGVATALMREGVTHFYQGDASTAMQLCQEALAIFQQIGNKSGLARALGNIAIMMKAKGDLNGAEAKYNESLAVFREIDDKADIATAFNNLANVRLARGDDTGARRMFEETLTAYREAGNRGGIALALNNIGSILSDQGHLDEAMKMFQESLALRQEMGDIRGKALALCNIAEIMVNRGDLAHSIKNYEEAVSLCVKSGDQSHQALALAGLGDVALLRGDLKSARKYYEETLAIRTQIDEVAAAAESRLALAEVALEEGRPSEAESAARQLAGEFRQQRSSDSEAQALILLIRSLLNQGKVADASQAAARAVEITKSVPVLKLRLWLAAARAGVLAASGNRAEAGRVLDEAVAQADTAHLTVPALELRLRTCELGLNRERNCRENIRQAAAVLGLELIARKAAGRSK